jgi:hypothetical protein
LVLARAGGKVREDPRLRTFLNNAVDGASRELRAKFSAICFALLPVNGAIPYLIFRRRRPGQKLGEPSAAP